MKALLATLKGSLLTLRGVLAIALLFLAFLVSFQTFLRYFLHRGLTWVLELSTIIFAWIIFLGAALAFWDKMHFAFKLGSERLGPRVGKGLNLFSALATVTFASLLFLGAYDMLKATGFFPTPVMGMPRWVLYLSLILSSVLTIVFTLVRVARTR